MTLRPWCMVVILAVVPLFLIPVHRTASFVSPRRSGPLERPPAVQRLQLDVSLVVPARRDTLFEERVAQQLKNLSLFMQSRSVRERGYNIQVNVVNIVETDNSSEKITVDNFEDICQRYPVPPGNLLVIASQGNFSKAGRNNPTVLGISDKNNCLVYSVDYDECGIILLHETLHTVFNLPHIEYCNMYQFGKIPAMTKSYQEAYCRLRSPDDVFTGLECAPHLEFRNSAFDEHAPKKRQKPPDPNRSEATANLSTLIRFEFANRNVSDSTAEWGPWTEWRSSFTEPHHISVRRRLCAAWCARSLTWVDFDVWIEPCLESSSCQALVDRFEEKVKEHSAPSTRPAININSNPYFELTNCFVQECLATCDHDHREVLPDGTLCFAPRSVGVCVTGMCISLDYTLHRNVVVGKVPKHTSGQEARRILEAQEEVIDRCSFSSVKVNEKTIARLREWVYEKHPLIRAAQSATRLYHTNRSSNLVAYGNTFCFMALKFLESNGFTTKWTRITVTTTGGVGLPRIEALCRGSRKIHAFACSKYVPFFDFMAV